MEIDRMIKDSVEKEVMQVINDFGIKSVMREKVVESGITKDDIKQMIKDAVDSYVRSADIKVIVRKEVERIVKNTVEKEIKEMFDLRTFDYKANSILREEMGKQVVNAFFNNFQFSVNVERKKRLINLSERRTYGRKEIIRGIKALFGR